MREKVEAALAIVRPFLQKDGGDVDLVEITPEGVVRVRLTGACKGCPRAHVTLRMGVEKVVLKEVPEAMRVEAVQDLS